MNLKIVEERLRREHNLPAEFLFSRWECLPHGSEMIYVEIRGCIPPMCKTGKRKGKPNWRAAVGHKIFNIPVHLSEQWEREWQAVTWKCIRCTGDGKIISKIDFVTKTTEYRPCDECNGTGKAPVATSL